MRVIRLLAAASLTCALAASPALAQTKKPAPPKPKISEETKAKAAETNANPEAVVLQDERRPVVVAA